MKQIDAADGLAKVSLSNKSRGRGYLVTARRMARVFRRGLNGVVLCSGLAMAGGAVPVVAGVQPAAARPAAAQRAIAQPTTAQPACAAPRRGMTACQIAVAAAGPGRGAASPAQAGSTPVGYGPPGLQAAYALPSATYGTGMTVAVVAPYDDPDVAGDLAAYRAQYGESACAQTLSQTAPACLTVVNGSTGALITPGSGTAPAPNTGWALQTSAQLDAISAVCPNCDLLLVEVNSPAITDVGQGVNVAVSWGAQVITIGVAQSETPSELTWDIDFNHTGVEITAAAGDVAGGSSGYSTNGVDYPAASPYVTAVGGTSLNAIGAGTCTAAVAGARGWCETAWNDSDGTSVSGCSLYEPEPAWQKVGIPAADTGCGSLRSVADVSADADPVTGIAVYDSYGEGGWQGARFGGTAVAAAIVAGADALAGKPALDVDPASYLYSNASGFNDITSGSNGTCSPAYLCTAGPGYDGPTGLGSPNGDSAFLCSYYQPVTPSLVLDTGTGTGTDGTVGPMKAGGTLVLQVTGVGGVPSANVTAVALTLTAIDETSSGNIVAYPDGSAPPGTSNLDYPASTDVANFAIVPVGTDGEIDFSNESTGTANVLAGFFGYFTSDPKAAGDTTYTPVTPIRILDTRNGTGAPEAKLTPNSSPLAVQVGGVNGIPSGISAVAIGLAAVDNSGDGNLVAWADGTARPNVAPVQFNSGRDVGAMAIVPVGTDGKIDIAEPDGTSTDVVGDVSGYFTTGTSGERYHAIMADRLIDTRNTTAVAAGGTLAVTPGAKVIAPAPDLVLNITATQSTGSGNLVVYAAGTSIPATSNLNFTTSQTIASLALGATGNGTVDIHNSSGGTVELIVDCLGYFSAG
jgi:hypothetical protein